MGQSKGIRGAIKILTAIWTWNSLSEKLLRQDETPKREEGGRTPDIPKYFFKAVKWYNPKQFEH